VADLRDGAATRRELVRQSIEILGLRGELASMRQEIAALIGHRGDDLNLLTSLRADVEALRGRYGKLERATSGLLEREEMRYQSVRDLAFRLQELEMAREVGDSLTQAEMADLRRLTVAREERLREVLRRIDDMKSADAEMAAQVNDVSGRVGLLSVALGGLAISVGHSMPDINAALTLTDDQARWLATVATNGQAEPAGAPPR
jgi:predicted nuclease with TOPRIM domain